MSILTILRFSSVLFAALALVPAGAHLSSLVSKMRLSGTEYLAAQRAYDGWSLFGIVIFAALLSTLALALVSYRHGRAYGLVSAAFLCIAATQGIFWTWTFPANQATANWTMLPEGWEALRIQWEYSHAASAVFNLMALVLLVLAMVRETKMGAGG